MNFLYLLQYLNQQVHELVYLNSGIQIVWLEIAVLDPFNASYSLVSDIILLLLTVDWRNQ